MENISLCLMLVVEAAILRCESSVRHNMIYRTLQVHKLFDTKKKENPDLRQTDDTRAVHRTYLLEQKATM